MRKCAASPFRLPHISSFWRWKFDCCKFTEKSCVHRFFFFPPYLISLWAANSTGFYVKRVKSELIFFFPEGFIKKKTKNLPEAVRRKKTKKVTAGKCLLFAALADNLPFVTFCSFKSSGNLWINPETQWTLKKKVFFILIWSICILISFTSVWISYIIYEYLTAN